VASLGTSGNTASSAAIPRMSGYTHPEAVTSSTSDSKTAALRAGFRDRRPQVGERVLADGGDDLRPLEQPRALRRSRPGLNVGVLEDLGECSPVLVLAEHVALHVLLAPRRTELRLEGIEPGSAFHLSLLARVL